METYPVYQDFVPDEYQPKLDKYDAELNMAYLPGVFYTECKHLPATKATRCLFKDFNLIPEDSSLFTYHLDPSIGEFHGLEAKWLVANIDKYICLQGNGHTMRREKNLSIAEVEGLCARIDSEYKVILIDFQGEFNVDHIKNAISTKDMPFTAGNLIYLIKNCSRYIGIDSGPKAVALALGKPTSVIFKLMHHFHNSEPFKHLTCWYNKQTNSRLFCQPGDDISWLEKNYTSVMYEDLVRDFSCNEIRNSNKSVDYNPKHITDKLRFKIRNL